jgi:site-specific recombinase XerD
MYLISELLREYFDDKDLKPSTRQAYGVAVRALIRQTGDCIGEEIDRKRVLQWRKEVLRVSLKEISWNTYMRELRALYQFGIDRWLIGIQQNPFNECNVRCPKRPNKTVLENDMSKARHLLSDMEQEEADWQQCSEFYPAWFWRCVFETFTYTGMRANELICLRPDDIDLHQKRIRVRAEVAKTHEERWIPIHDSLQSHLTKLVYLAKKKKVTGTQQLFNVNVFSPRHFKRRMDMDQIGAFYKRLSAKLDVAISPHRFRHTLASRLMREPDRDIHTVKEILGHRNIATTMKYISVNFEQMRELLNEVR